MTALVTVRVEGTSALRRRVAEVVASLPTSFQLTNGRADVIALDGAENWPERASRALNAGARAIIVIDPASQDASALLADSRRHTAPVLLDTPWAHNPVVRAAAEEFAQHVTPTGLVEAGVISPIGRTVFDALPAQLALVGAITGPIAIAHLVAASDRGYTVLGTTASGIRLRLLNVVTDAVPTTAGIRFIGRASSVQVQIPDPATAQPARLTVTTPDGATMRPTIFESARRSGWRALHAALTTGGSLPDLQRFVDETTIVAGLCAEAAALAAKSALMTEDRSENTQRSYAQ